MICIEDKKHTDKSVCFLSFYKDYILKKKRIFILIFLILLSSQNVFSGPYIPSNAQPPSNTGSTMKSTQEIATEKSFRKILGTILTLIGSPYVRILALASLIYISIKLILTKNKDEFLKRIYGWIIAAILVTLAPSVISKIFQIKDSVQSLQTFSLFNTPSYSETKKK